MKADLTQATRAFQREVEAEAVRIVERGEAAPYDAVAIARQRVLQRRQYDAGAKGLHP